MMSRRACRLAEKRVHVPGMRVFPATGRPFSAKDNIKWTRYREGGSSYTTYLFSTVARDSQGRIYRENRHFAPGSTLQPLEEKYFLLLDPIAHTRTRCTPKTRRCTVGSWKASTTFSPTPDRLHDEDIGNLSSENLGKDVIEGLNVVGTRETLSFAPGVARTTEPLIAVREYWYSPDLQVNLSVTRRDPRTGTQVIQLVDLSRNEPDPAIFQVPDGFTIQDKRVAARNEKLLAHPAVKP